MAIILTNFAFGNGPYARAIDLAIDINQELVRRGDEKHQILVPWVYGERQKRIIEEDFGSRFGKYVTREDIILDKTLGGFLSDIFYKGTNYQEDLENIIKTQERSETGFNERLKERFTAVDLAGNEVQVNGDDIVFEVSHNPKVVTDLELSYYTTIAPFSEILRETVNSVESGELSGFKLDTLADAIEIANKIEKSQTILFQPEPFVFSYKEGRGRPYNEVFIPPLIHPPEPNNEKIAEGLYTMITGIGPGLKDLFDKVAAFGMKIYYPPFVKDAGFEGDNSHTPDIIANPNIIYFYARSGWSSVWHPHMTETPLITPAYKEKDDPEIFFNEKTIERLRLGVVFHSNDYPTSVLSEADTLVPNYRDINRRLINNYQTLDGITYAARVITAHLKNKNIEEYRDVPAILQVTSKDDPIGTIGKGVVGTSRVFELPEYKNTTGHNQALATLA